MHFTRTINSLFLLAALAAAGVLMVWVPTQVVQQYQAVKDLGTIWVYVYFGVVGTGAALLAGVTSYTLYTLWNRNRRKQLQREGQSRNPSQLSSTEQQREFEQNLAEVEKLQGDPHISPELRSQLEPLVAKLAEKRETKRLEIVAFGTISSGKSSLLNALAGRDVFTTDLKGGTTVCKQELPWPGADQVVLVDTPGLAEVDGAEHVGIAAEAAQDADIVLVVVDGPLREAEHRLLLKLAEMEKRILVCLNKADWYSEQDQRELLGQITRQLAPLTAAANIVAVRSQVSHRLRVRVTSTGEELEETVPVPADISVLAKRMLELVHREGEEILLANLLLQSRGLVDEAKQKAQEALDRRARKIVDKYTWGAGGAAALSPTPVLDLLAGSAITAKMVVDLAAVYKQDIDLKSAMELIAQLGKNLIAILGVNAAGPAVASGVASVLKTVPGAGTIAGGLLQGVVQAMVTRWIGAVFMEYFRNEMRPPEGGLAMLARREWQHLTSLAELKRLMNEARCYLMQGSSRDD